MNRASRLQALAWSLPDLQPAPVPDPVFSGRKAAERGPAPGAWAECTACNGKGEVRRRLCQECLGAGRYKIDTYVEERVSSETAPTPRHPRTVICDRCDRGLIPAIWVGAEGQGTPHVRCPSCDGTGHLQVWVNTDELDGMILTDRRNRMRAQGSYQELEAALAWLRSRDLTACRAYVSYAQDTSPRTFMVDAAESRLLLWMPHHIRVPKEVREAWASRNDRAQKANERRSATRDERIARMMLAGNHTSHVARTVGCSEDTVLRVFARVKTLEAA